MRKVLAVAFGALATYSVALAALELHSGARLARVYLEDPPLVLPFAGIHTALSAALLGACALVFAACRRTEAAARHLEAPRARFLEIQVGFFGFLAADEMFRIVPMLAARLGLPEGPCYLALGLFEAAVLVGPGQLRKAPGRARAAAAAAAMCFTAALALDHAPLGLPLRECLEELPKVWGGAFFLSFAWSRLEEALDALAFPGIAGTAFQWARGSRESSSWTAAPFVAPRGRSAGPVVAPVGQGARGAAVETADAVRSVEPVEAHAEGERNGAPLPRKGAPEPDPQGEVLSVSAAPPRKLLSH